MTYSHETPTHIADPIAAPSAVRAAAIETLRAAMVLYITRLPGLARQNWRHIAKARTMLRKLFKAERESFAAWALATLRRNAYWQDRVLGDLGGHHALRRWERRQRLSQVPKRPSVKVKRTRTPPARAKIRRASGCKTDRFGMFRLAVISTHKTAQKSRRTGYRYCGHRPSWNFDIKPIGITPDDLRGDSRDNLGGGASIHQDPTAGTNPETLWLDICQQIVMWECEICGVETQVLCGEGPSSPKNAEAPP